ncbi:MAG: 4Fe-4S dicluster domain-containing protein [Candidatus Bathyarchaeota archaeon]
MDEQPKEIYEILLESEKIRKKKLRAEFLRAVGVSDQYFEEGNIKIDSSTCKGTECKLCVKACPTNALYWNEGKVKIEKDICIYCSACVLSCMVDNCIVIARKRKSGEIEKFGTPREVALLMDRRIVQRRGETLKSILAELTKTEPNKK